MTKTIFQINLTLPGETDGKMRPHSVLVMSKEEYDEFLDDIRQADVFAANAGIRSSQMIDKLRVARHIPIVARGNKTESLFVKYGIETETFGVILRGTADALLHAYGPDAKPFPDN